MWRGGRSREAETWRRGVPLCVFITAGPTIKLCVRVLPVNLRRCLFLLFGSTLVVKITKTQESTPRFLKRITEDKENIVLLPVDSGLSVT